MKIDVQLNTQSIQKAIESLKKAENQLKTKMIPDFLVECCKWFIQRANRYLDKSQIGQNIVNEIKNSWSYTVSLDGKSARVVNDDDHAVFVEFGVGLVGGQIPHPMASVEGYEYNQDTAKKRYDGYWVFNVESESDVDMQQGYISKNAKNGGLWIITKGSWGELYAYRTLMDFSLEKKVLQGLWKKIKLRYWG